MKEAIVQEKRNQFSPVPDNLSAYLSIEQLKALEHFANFGIKPAFVRRPAFGRVVVMLKNDEGEILGMLKDDGHIDQNADIKLRH